MLQSDITFLGGGLLWVFLGGLLCGRIVWRF